MRAWSGIGRVLGVLIVLMVAYSLPVAAESADLSLAAESDGNAGEPTKTITDSNATLNGDYWRGYISDTQAVVTSPLHWQGSDWGKAGLILGITCVLYMSDTEIRDWFQDNRSDTRNSMAKVAKHFGDASVIIPLSALYLYGYESDDSRARRTAMLGLESFVESTLITGSLKFIGHRSRPDTGDDYDTWDGINLSGDDDHLSFPSTHAACAFSVATVVAEEYKDHPMIPILSYSLATLTALSRINDDEHWASDVFVGSAIGYFTAKAILNRHPADGKSWTVIPTVDGRSLGLGVSYQF